MKKNSMPVPIVGSNLKFFDDGKISKWRIYNAKVTYIIYKDSAKNYKLEFPDKTSKKLYDFWQDEINNHINTENFQVLPYKIGEPWLYARDTDFFVFCDIPEYSDLSVIFVRDVENRWFSLGYPNSFDGGILDVTGELYNSIKNE